MTKNRPRNAQGVAFLIDMIGITQPEAVDYLAARGIKTAVGSMRSWNRGFYNAPLPVYRELWLLWLGVYGTLDMPPEAPASAILRKEMIAGMQEWSDEEDLEDWHDPDAEA